MKTHITHSFKSRHIWLLQLLCVVASLCLMSAAQAQQPVKLSGYVAAKSVDCFNSEHHDHGPAYFLVDDATGEWVPLKGYDKQLQGIHPRQKVSIRGVRRNDAANAASGKLNKAQQEAAAGSPQAIDVQEIDVLPMTEQAAAQEPAPANGANSLTMLSTLLVFISTDTNTCMTSETNARNRLFNNTTNANLGMQAITKGRYGLQLGNGTGVPQDHVINLRLNVNSVDHSSSSIETLALNKLFNSVASGGMGLTRTAWNRILLFAPGGITDSGFTAYAYYPWGSYTTSGLVSMYGSSYGNSRMNGYLHELGHNFGFNHSSKGGSEYGDRTCVMGTSSDGTRTETYNAVKLLETDWLNAFTNAKKAVTADTTIDLYPLSSDPNIGTIAVSFPGTDYYAAYHRDQQPYGFLSQAGDKDKVFVYTRATGSFIKSFQVANLAVGGSYNGPGVVSFERYGPNNEYATVSFDMNDGNAKPVANAQLVSVTTNTSRSITLSGSDADGNTLTYTKVTDPTKGVLSGTAPNFTYTPNNNYLGSDSFVFKVNDGKISSFATVSITVIAPNAAPVANNKSVNVFLNTPEPITLTATDGNGDSLTYTVLSNPSKGALSGTPPNLIYTPNNGISGSDSFTFRANDGYANSNTATVSIAISSSPNTPPTVYAGLDQTLYLVESNAVLGWTYAAWTGDADSGISSSNTYTAAHCFGDNNAGTVTVNGVAFTESFASSGTGWSVTGSQSNWTGNDDAIVTGNSEKLAQEFIYAGNPRTITLTGLTPGQSYQLDLYSAAWETGDRSQTFSATGGSSAVINQDAYNNNNGIRISCVYTASATSQSFTITPVGIGTFHFYAMSNHATTIIAAIANLDGTVTDGEQTPTGNWSVVSGPAGVFFGDSSAIDTTATFSASGTYTLRLTANDGYVTASDDVVITVIADDYTPWAGIYSGTDLSDPNADADGDGQSNHFERAFGLDPTSPGSSNPISVPLDTATGTLNYTRRNPSLTGLNYTVWYSSDLSTWDQDTGAQQIAGTADANGVQSVVVTMSSALMSNPSLFIRIRAQ